MIIEDEKVCEEVRGIVGCAKGVLEAEGREELHIQYSEGDCVYKIHVEREDYSALRKMQEQIKEIKGKFQAQEEEIAQFRVAIMAASVLGVNSVRKD